MNTITLGKRGVSKSEATYHLILNNDNKNLKKSGNSKSDSNQFTLNTYLMIEEKLRSLNTIQDSPNSQIEEKVTIESIIIKKLITNNPSNKSHEEIYSQPAPQNNLKKIKQSTRDDQKLFDNPSSQLKELDELLTKYSYYDILNTIYEHSNKKHEIYDTLILPEAVFENTSINIHKFKNVSLYQCYFNNIKFNNIFEFANHKNKQVELYNTTLHDCQLINTDFTNSKIEDFYIENCILNDVSFKNAEIKNTIIQNCTLNNVDFAQTTLENFRIQNCKLVNVNFENTLSKSTIMQTVNLTNTKILESTSLENFHLCTSVELKNIIIQIEETKRTSPNSLSFLSPLDKIYWFAYNPKSLLGYMYSNKLKVRKTAEFVIISKAIIVDRNQASNIKGRVNFDIKLTAFGLIEKIIHICLTHILYKKTSIKLIKILSPLYHNYKPKYRRNGHLEKNNQITLYFLPNTTKPTILGELKQIDDEIKKLFSNHTGKENLETDLKNSSLAQESIFLFDTPCGEFVSYRDEYMNIYNESINDYIINLKNIPQIMESIKEKCLNDSINESFFDNMFNAMERERLNLENSNNSDEIIHVLKYNIVNISNNTKIKLSILLESFIKNTTLPI